MRRLGEPDPHLVARPPGPQQPDRVPEALLDGTPAGLRDDLVALLGQAQVRDRLSDLVGYATEGGPYRLVPQVVVVPRDVPDVVAVLRYCADHGRRATFRAAGTSLCGQSQSDDVLIDVRRHFAGVRVEDEGRLLRAGCGAVLGHANAVLRRHGRRLGPDPASESAATIGGVIANNAAGMRCGPEASAYATVESMTVVTPSGTVLDTAGDDAEQRFRDAEPRLAQGLAQVRAEVLADPELTARIRRKYEIRNTTGYALCAVLDGTTPLEIYRRLLVGSEGTLGFVAEAVLRTVPVAPVSGVCWIVLPTVSAAAGIIPALTALGAQAVELLVGTILSQAASRLPGLPREWLALPPGAGALLVEFGGADHDRLTEAERSVRDLLVDSEPLLPVELLHDTQAIDLSWKVRKGMLGDMALGRGAGASMITEDFAVSPARVAQAATDVVGLLERYGYPTMVVGHAAYGNLHFLLTPRLDDPRERSRYASFTDELVELVVDRYDGSLKGEHGTGRAIAPYVEREWGGAATAVMRRIKDLADPAGILGPDVVLTGDPHLHLAHLKSTPVIEAEATACIECGFCEPVCPSRLLTTTPRERIVLRREMARQPEGSPVLRRLQEEYAYDAIQTCAVDGSCAMACPVGIDTGVLVKGFRRQLATPRAERVAAAMARRWGVVEAAARGALRAAALTGRIVGHRPLRVALDQGRRVVSPDVLPTVPGELPRPAGPVPATSSDGAAAVYYPACVNRIFGTDRDATDVLPVTEALVAVSARAGQPVWIPPDVGGHCCGTPWSSKGYAAGQAVVARRLARAVVGWSAGGRLPVVVDASSCTLSLIRQVPSLLSGADLAAYREVEVLDSTAWCARLLEAGLPVRERIGVIAIHPGCSVATLGATGVVHRVAAALADEVDVPEVPSCCGSAGDRSLLHPELTAAATLGVCEQWSRRPAQAYLSANRTCEMGLRQATGRPFASLVQQVEKATRE